MVAKVWDEPEVYLIPVPLPDNPLRSLNAYVIKSGEYSIVFQKGAQEMQNIVRNSAAIFLSKCGKYFT